MPKPLSGRSLIQAFIPEKPRSKLIKMLLQMQILSSTLHSIFNHIKSLLHQVSYRMISKRILSCFLILFALLNISSTNPLPPEGEKFIIVIDPGHGGRDPGTIGKISKEKDIALKISLKVGKYIEENLNDVKVIYTRTTDVYPELHERTSLANRSKADLFISIHVDGFHNKNVYGTSSFVMGLHKNEESLAVAQRENAVIMAEEDYQSKYAGFDPSSPESYIRITLEQNTYMELSLLLAANIQDQFEHRAKRKSRGVQQAGFVVLWQTTMPSVLIETGFLTNPAEEKFLNSDYGQDLIASGIYRAFRDYKNEISSKTISASELQKIDSLNAINSLPEKVIIDDHDESGIVFKVQIASSVKPISTDPKNFAGLENVQEVKINDSYKYTVGHARDYDEIYKLYKETKKKIPDAFLVAFKDGTKISVRKAKKELKNSTE